MKNQRELLQHAMNIDASLATDAKGNKVNSSLPTEELTPDLFVDEEMDPHGGNDNNRRVADRVENERRKLGLKSQRSPFVAPISGDGRKTAGAEVAGGTSATGTANTPPAGAWKPAQ